MGRLAISTCCHLLSTRVSGTQATGTPTCWLTPMGPLGRRAFQQGWEAHHEDLPGGELGSSSSNVVCLGRESCLKYSLMCLSLHVHLSASVRHPCVNVRMYVHILAEWIFPTVLLTFVHVSMSWDLGIRSGKRGEDGIPWHQRPSCWRQSDGLGHCNIIWEVEPDDHGGPFNPNECDLRPLCITTQT